MTAPIRLGIVGAGSVFARGHLPAIKAQPNSFKIAALSRRDPDKLAEAMLATGCQRGLADWREVVADPDVDAVVIASPNALHAAQALAAIEAGKDVLCEKPPAVTYKEARAIAAAAERHGRIVQYGFLMRFADETRRARQALEEGLLGNVYHVRASWIRRRGYPTKGSWFTTKALAGGGTLVDIGCHLLDRALHLLNYPDVLAVSAVTHARLRESTVAHALPTGTKSGMTGICDVEDLGTCLFRLKHGVSLTLETSFAANLPDQPPLTEFLGDRAGLRVEMAGKVTLFGEALGAVTDTALAAPPPSGPGALPLYQREYEHFAQCVRSRQTPGPNAEQGAKLMQALEAAYLSAANGREVRIEEVPA
ncbi:MAG: Gfo/Idh/MocA family oxidoreductase [Planctomycetota bacterium]|nr:Gfo/Idh/MocA family oxidoreductase [Planctomycetota bacterium]